MVTLETTLVVKIIMKRAGTLGIIRLKVHIYGRIPESYEERNNFQVWVHELFQRSAFSWRNGREMG
ncbi:hypothetical protein RM553_08025 [Zunongwangia sp. F363]|uniref:Uncharacterized protein n=1 Tax=Autumnicola tepida TaxID=3075595 RepID=A0ABU3C967_9FLAO|nr:hypothetical protein [Zunongwangia sp. F363]MDT0642777.1 hypothetical protein [Zunongwangia sp. F363]